MKKIDSVLIAVASYGTAQDHFLKRVVAEFRKLKIRSRIVVLSNIGKVVAGAEVVAGLPTSNPYSLPFAHRKLIADNVDKHDLFIYTEDDTLLTARNIEAFLAMQRHLGDDEIAGFIRSETDPDHQVHITSINTHFRWLPETLVTRGGELFAQLTNQHSGCFIATREQVVRAIASGGFLVQPHLGTYGMLESAASDIYTRCGLRRLLCISRITDFIVPHLPNKYYLEMGIPFEELESQIKTLSDIQKGERWTGSLLEPLSREPGFRWSKVLYERPDEEILRLIPPATRSVLSVGTGWGETEARISRSGIDVCAVPVDGVFGGSLRRRGIPAVEGPFAEVLSNLEGRSYDVVLLTDVLHLVDRPADWLRKLRALLSSQGCIIARVSNTSDVIAWIKDLRQGRNRPLFLDYHAHGVQPVSVGRMRRWCLSGGLNMVEVIPKTTGKRRLVSRRGPAFLQAAVADKYIFKALRSP